MIVIRKTDHICLCILMICSISQFYACTKIAILEMGVFQPITQIWNPGENRWEVSLDGEISEKNGGGCTIERIWCDWSWRYQIGGEYSGLIAESTGGNLSGHGSFRFHLEGYIFDERELEVIVFAETYDNNGNRRRLEVNTVSEYIYP